MRQVLYEGYPGQVAVRFVYVDAQAKTVCVSGSFNNWSEDSHCMEESFNVWFIELALPPGRHEYLFVIDGRIGREDPRNVLAEDNGFGMKNSVLFVE
jgi:1,4-alpha-glucan branching enzyme